MAKSKIKIAMFTETVRKTLLSSVKFDHKFKPFCIEFDEKGGDRFVIELDNGQRFSFKIRELKQAKYD